MKVASYVDAWIESVRSYKRMVFTTSSHPMWMRGLKAINDEDKEKIKRVASYVDAWIESDEAEVHRNQNHRVASYVDAWIESDSFLSVHPCKLVASYVDAWIERSTVLRCDKRSDSVASYVDAWIERRRNRQSDCVKRRSHPMWMRGLKV